MAAKNPRLSIVIEPSVYKLIKQLAKNEETTISKKAKSLLMEALELYEDFSLSALANQRENSLKGELVPHEDVW